MSFDVYIDCPCCESSLYDFNITHNVNGIVDRCLRESGATAARRPSDDKRSSSYDDYSWGRLHGWPASEALAIVARALDYACHLANEPRLREMEPPNGWGSLQGVRDSLEHLKRACSLHPKGVIRVSG